MKNWFHTQKGEGLNLNWNDESASLGISNAWSFGSYTHSRRQEWFVNVRKTILQPWICFYCTTCMEPGALVVNDTMNDQNHKVFFASWWGTDLQRGVHSHRFWVAKSNHHGFETNPCCNYPSVLVELCNQCIDRSVRTEPWESYLPLHALLTSVNACFEEALFGCLNQVSMQCTQQMLNSSRVSVWCRIWTIFYASVSVVLLMWS